MNEQQAKDFAKERDGGRCVFCQWKPRNRSEKRYIHAHHILPKSSHKNLAADTGNLITVCWLHHFALSEYRARRMLLMSTPDKEILSSMKKSCISTKGCREKFSRFTHKGGKFRFAEIECKKYMFSEDRDPLFGIESLPKSYSISIRKINGVPFNQSIKAYIEMGSDMAVFSACDRGDLFKMSGALSIPEKDDFLFFSFSLNKIEGEKDLSLYSRIFINKILFSDLSIYGKMACLERRRFLITGRSHDLRITESDVKNAMHFYRNGEFLSEWYSPEKFWGS